MKIDTYFVTIAALFIVCGVVWISGSSVAHPPDSDIGRYQVATSGSEKANGPIFVTVIDTTDGRIVLQKRYFTATYEVAE